jgi:hypothetical protein
MTPSELAREIWGPSQDDSRSWGARRVREVAREAFPDDAPGQGRDWELTREQADEVRRLLSGSQPPE